MPFSGFAAFFCTTGRGASAGFGRYPPIFVNFARARIEVGVLCYPVRFWHRNSDLMDELAEKLCSCPGAYGSEGVSLALGSAQCLGWIDGAKLLETEKIESNCLKTRFAAPISAVNGLDRTVSLRDISLLKEETIVEFDANRTITEKSKQDILISDNGTSISFQLNPAVPHPAVNW